MNYTQITATALAFADRTDTETTSNMDNFIRMVEAKINRVLRTQQMESGATVTVLAGLQSVAVPPDCAEIREVTLYTGSSAPPMQFVTPRQYFNVLSGITDVAKVSQGAAGIYTLITGQLSIYPPSDVDTDYVLVYYKKVEPLLPTAPDNTNWISEQFPDVYISGIVYEISCFVKNPEAAQLWLARFQGGLGELTEQNWLAKWPGASLVMTVEN